MKAVAIAGNGEGDQLIYLADDTDPTKLGVTVYQWQHETGEISRVVDDIEACFIR